MSKRAAKVIRDELYDAVFSPTVSVNRAGELVRVPFAELVRKHAAVGCVIFF
jgi:hypothetical protein